MVRWAERGAVSFIGLIAVSLALASCGGRASSLQANGSGNAGGGAGSSQGGATAVGGSTSRGGAGTTSIGGATAGSGATAGAGTLPGSDAGPPVCNDNCPEIACPSGQTLEYPDTLCCPICESCSAPDQACPPSDDCGPAAHLEIPAGQCCAQCVANDPVACMNQIQTANDSANAALQKHSMQCQVDSDCEGALLVTTCTNTCIYAPKASLAAYLADLMIVEDCSACALPPPTGSTCDSPVCSNQTCHGIVFLE